MDNNRNGGFPKNYHYPGPIGYDIPSNTYYKPVNQNSPSNEDKPESDGMSLAALICGIIGIVLSSLVLSVLAFVFAGKYRKTHDGRHCGQSNGAVICGVIGTVTSLIVCTVLCIVILTELL